MTHAAVSQTDLETIIRNTPDGVVVVDGEGNTCYANPAAEALFGLPGGQLLGQPFGHPVSEGERTEIQIIRRYREPVQAEMNVAAIEWQGRPATVVSLRDITARKEMEAALRENQARLKEAKEAADAANTAKSRFLANMSHELRTPLNAILGYAQLLVRDPRLSEEHREAAATIHSSGEHLLTLISDLLDIAKIEAGKIALESKVFDFRAFLQSVIEPMAFKAREKAVSLTLDDAAGPAHVRGDEKRMRQVLLNLLSNAVKFTEKGRVVLTVRYKDGQAHFEVADTGVGIPAEAHQTIFNPFEQGADALKGGDGTGLGLAISATLVRLMGGEIVVGSAPGRGSAFRFAIPMEKAAPPRFPAVEPATRAVSEPGAILGPGGRRLTALIVDDNALNRLLAKGMMTRLGFEVIQSNNGSDAVQKTAAGRPDIVLLDLFMPVMDGFQAVSAIREAAAPNVPVVMAVTADVSKETRDRCASVGFDDFIEKPISLDELTRKLRDHFGSHPPPDPAPDLHCQDAETLAALSDLASMGDIGGIRSLAEKQKEVDQGAAPFYERLIDCARQFRLDEVAALIQKGTAGDRGERS